MSHLWTGATCPQPDSLAAFVCEVFRNTGNRQITFLPEFTDCKGCGKIDRGLYRTCRFCGSDNVDGISKITGYFARVSSLNKGKIAELHDVATISGFFPK